MEIENIFDIGRLLGICKIWTVGLKALESPFYQTMPAPLISLKNKLEQLEIQKVTIEEIDFHLDKFQEVFEIRKERNKLSEEKNSKKYNELNKEGTKILEIMQEQLIKKIPIWEDRITNELIKIKTVKLSTDTILNPEKLSIGAVSFFDKKIWDEMSDLEKNDLDDGCRCISLQAWTPAGMITMRVIESVIRNYYQKQTSRDPTGKMWGQMLTDLKAIPSANQKLIGYFEYLKDKRNTLQHPEARLSQFESEDVFHHAIHILNIVYS